MRFENDRCSVSAEEEEAMVFDVSGEDAVTPTTAQPISRLRKKPSLEEKLNQILKQRKDSVGSEIANNQLARCSFDSLDLWFFKCI